MNDFIRLIDVLPRCPKLKATVPTKAPANTNMAKYFTGTRPININNIHVLNNINAVDKLANAIKPQMIPLYINTGTKDFFQSSMLF